MAIKPAPPSPPAPPRASEFPPPEPRRSLSARFAGDDAVPRGLAVTSAIMLRLAIVIGGLYLLVLAAGRLLLLVLPVVVALFLATLLSPAARWLERRRTPPAAAAGLLVLAAALFFLGLIGLIIPSLATQVGDVGTTVQQGTRQLAGTLRPLGITEAQVDAAIQRGLDNIQGSGQQVLSEVVSGAALAASWSGALILAMVLAFFFVKDGKELWGWIVELFSERRRYAVREVGERSWDALSAYVRGVLLVATVDAVLIGIAILAVGVPFALPLIVFTFLAAFFPIVGAVLAGVVAVLVALVAKGAVAALIILAVIIVVQQVEGNVLYPVVVGRRVNLHAVAILVALTAGGLIAGVAGAFLSVPLAAIAAAILDYSRQRDRREEREQDGTGARVMPADGVPAPLS